MTALEWVCEGSVVWDVAQIFEWRFELEPELELVESSASHLPLLS